MPIGMGEPHYAQIIKADKLAPWEVYPEIGLDPSTMSVDPNAPVTGNERIERNGDTVEIWHDGWSGATTRRIGSRCRPGIDVIWHITNIDTSIDATHGFALPAYNINLSLEPGETATIEFDADQAGTFPFYCTEFCSALHLEMAGYFLVETLSREGVAEAMSIVDRILGPRVPKEERQAQRSAIGSPPGCSPEQRCC